MEKHIRELKRALEKDDLRLIDLKRTGKGHYKATIEAPDKRRLIYVLACSSSDRRAETNRLQDIRRFFNN